MFPLSQELSGWMRKSRKRRGCGSDPEAGTFFCLINYGFRFFLTIFFKKKKNPKPSTPLNLLTQPLLFPPLTIHSSLGIFTSAAFSTHLSPVSATDSDYYKRGFPTFSSVSTELVTLVSLTFGRNKLEFNTSWTDLPQYQWFKTITKSPLRLAKPLKGKTLKVFSSRHIKTVPNKQKKRSSLAVQR